MPDYAELIERLEKATGPDRELDAIIMRAIYPELGDTMVTDTGWCVGGDHDAPSKSRPYTASVDAALTLVPDGHSYELTKSAASNFSRAELWNWRRSPPASDHGNEWKSEGNRPLAINIIIAALRARASEVR